MRKHLTYLLSLLILSSLLATNSLAESYEDKKAKFKIDFDENWEPTTDLSPTVVYSLVSVKRASSGRPSARLRIALSNLDKDLSLAKYIKNNVKTASAMWKVLKEMQLSSLQAENSFLVMERKIGDRKKQVQKLFVKSNGKVYEVTCSMSKLADDSFKGACAKLFDSFALIP